MKKIIYGLVLICLLLPLTVSALKTGIVIEVESETYYSCVDIESGDSVYNVLDNLDEKRNDISMTIDGELTGTYYLRTINGLSHKTVDGKYYGWNFFVTNVDNNDFTDPPEIAPGWNMGIGDYKITKEESIGITYSYTIYNLDWTIDVSPEKPSFLSYDQLCNNLKIKNVDFYVDGDKESGTIKVEPNSKLEVRVELENLYSKEMDVEINGVLVTALLDGIDDGEYIEEEAEDFDLNPGKSKTAKIEFEIPLEVEEGEYDLEILVEAEDDAKTEYGLREDFKVEVDKKSHELMFTRLELSKEELECDRQSNVDVSLVNIGTKEEDVVLQIVNSDLGLNVKKEFTLSEEPFDDDSRFSELIPIKINNEVKAGEYSITVKASYNKGNDEVKETLNLVVKDCDNNIVEETEEEEVVEDNSMEEVTGAVVYEETSEDYIGILMGLGVAVIVLVILLVVFFVVKK